MWDGLPEAILNELNRQFSKEQQLDNPYNVLKRTIESMTPKSNFDYVYKLPDRSEYKKALDGIEVFRKGAKIQDYYNISQTTLGKGGYAFVRVVTRIADQKLCAMKVVDYHKMKFDEKEMESLTTEIGLL